MGKERAELHAHTNKSILQGISSMQDIIESAEKLNLKAIAITDNGGINDLIKIQELKETKNLKLKIIYGLELIVDGNSVTILAKNSLGVKNIYKLVSNAELVNEKFNVNSGIFEKYKKGLIIGSGTKNGELYKAIVNECTNSELEEIVLKYDYLEIHGGETFGSVNQKVNKKIVELGEAKEKIVAAISKPTYINKNDWNFKEVLNCGTDFKYSDVSYDYHMQSTEELLEVQKYLGEEKAYEIVVTNSNLIADMCEKIELQKEKIVPYIEKSKQTLRTFVKGRAKAIYGDILPDHIQKRLDKELKEIVKNGFESIYIGVYELECEARRQAYSVELRNFNYKYSFVAFLMGLISWCPPFDDESYEMFLAIFKDNDVTLNVTGEYMDEAAESLKKIYNECNCYGSIQEDFVRFNDAWKFNKEFKKVYKESDDIIPEELTDVVDKLENVKNDERCIECECIFIPKNLDITDFVPIKYDEKTKVTAPLMNIGIKFKIILIK